MVSASAGSSPCAKAAKDTAATRMAKKGATSSLSFLGYFLLLLLAVYHLELKHGLRLAQFDPDVFVDRKVKFVVQINPGKVTGGLMSTADKDALPWGDDEEEEEEEFEWEGIGDDTTSNQEENDSDIVVTTPQQDLFHTYRSDDERNGRSTRFPSVGERVRRYMSSWYLPPCLNNKESQIILDYHKMTYQGDEKQVLYVTETAAEGSSERNVYRLDSVPKDNLIFYMDRKGSSNTSVECGSTLHCEDTMLTVLDSLAAKGEDASSPLLLQYGDSLITRAFNMKTKMPKFNPNLPVFVGFREAYSEKDEDYEELQKLFSMTETACSPAPQKLYKTLSGRSRLQPIVWKRQPKHEIEVLQRIPESDIPWSKKENRALFRGTLSGVRNGGLTLAMEKAMPKKAVCMHIPRCFLALHYAESPLIDAKLVGEVDPAGPQIPRYIDEVEIFTEKKLTYRDALQYKAQIVLEGDDVATNLKWALYSQSVVLTPPPTRTDWFMEEMLEPWVHYVPLSPSLSDVERKVQWVIDNDEEAQEIARRGFLWIQDLLFHPDADKDDMLVSEEIFRRFQKHFVLNKAEPAAAAPKVAAISKTASSSSSLQAKAPTTNSVGTAKTTTSAVVPNSKVPPNTASTTRVAAPPPNAPKATPPSAPKAGIATSSQQVPPKSAATKAAPPPYAPKTAIATSSQAPPNAAAAKAAPPNAPKTAIATSSQAPPNTAATKAAPPNAPKAAIATSSQQAPPNSAATKATPPLNAPKATPPNAPKAAPLNAPKAGIATSSKAPPTTAAAKAAPPPNAPKGTIRGVQAQQ